MSDALGPGTPLICVDASPPPGGWLGKGLRQGVMYFCDELVPLHGRPCLRCNQDHLAVALRGLSDMIVRGARPAFCPGRFKPLNGDDEALRAEPDWLEISDEDIADSILRTLPPKEREPA